MTNDETMGYVLKGILSEMTEEEQTSIQAAKDEINSVISKHGEFGTIAFTMISVDLLTEKEEK